MLFSLVSQVVLLLLCRITAGHLSQHSKAATALLSRAQHFQTQFTKKCDKFKSVQFLSFSKKTNSGITL
jgi:hypothetical protein